MDEAGVNAIICLQSDVCHEALQIGCARWQPLSSCIPACLPTPRQDGLSSCQCPHLYHRHNLHMHHPRSWDAIRQRAIEREVVITRVAVRDFDHGDQVGTLG